VEAGNKRLFYITSSRNRWLMEASLEDAYRSVPFGQVALLYNLDRYGWKAQKSGFHASVCPWQVARTMKQFKPSMVLTSGTTGFSPVFARRMSRYSVPIVIAWEDYYDVLWRANFGRVAGAFMRWFERQLVIRSDYVITISLYNKSRAEAWGKKTWYVPNGCDVPEYDQSKCAVRLEGKMNLVYCGDQGPYKQAGDIIKVMGAVPPEIKLYLVGDPNPAFHKYASSNVIFLGRLSENDKWAVMSRADVLVCTANTDCNAKFHEYLRMGKPILGYDGIPNYLFNNRRNALLTKDYPSAIMELYRSPELRRSLAENAAKDIPVYEWREIARRFDLALLEIQDEYRSRTTRLANGRGCLAHQTEGL